MFLAPGCIFVFSLSQNPMIVSTCLNPLVSIKHLRNRTLEGCSVECCCWEVGGLGHVTMSWRQATNENEDFASKRLFFNKKNALEEWGVHQQK